MKRMILLATALLSFAFTAQAASPMAETTIKGKTSVEKTLVNLFNKEAKIPNSPINAYLAALRADNEGFQIDDTIAKTDIVRLESGATAGKYEVDYLILIRAGFKSNTFLVGYLKAQEYGPIDEDGNTISVQITEPAKVTIE